MGISIGCLSSRRSWNEGGKGESIWDIYTKIPGTTFKGTNGDIAVDHYNRYKEDVALMAEMGLKAYRFSISWSRIYPEGRGEVNEEGLKFYDDLIDELLKNNIKPIIQYIIGIYLKHFKIYMEDGNLRIL